MLHHGTRGDGRASEVRSRESSPHPNKWELSALGDSCGLLNLAGLGLGPDTLQRPLTNKKLVPASHIEPTDPGSARTASARTCLPASRTHLSPGALPTSSPDPNLPAEGGPSPPLLMGRVALLATT